MAWNFAFPSSELPIDPAVPVVPVGPPIPQTLAQQKAAQRAYAKEAERRRKSRERQLKQETKDAERMLAQERRARQQAEAAEARKAEQVRRDERRRSTDQLKELQAYQQEMERIQAASAKQTMLEAKQRRDQLFQHAKTCLERIKEVKRQFGKRFDEFEAVGCGLGGVGSEWTPSRLAELPVASLKTIYVRAREEAATATGDEEAAAAALQMLELALAATDSQLALVQLWTHSDGRTIAQQGTVGFNAMATRVLRTLGVDGVRECGRDGRMLHQAVVHTLLSPLTPIKRALVVHSTGSGKTRVMLNCIEAHFHDPRVKVVFTPTYGLQLQMVREMLDVMSADSHLGRWYRWWREHNPEKAEGRDAMQHLVAALSFRQLRSAHHHHQHSRSAATAAAGGAAAKEEEDKEEEEDDDDDEEARRTPDMTLDVERFRQLRRLREGTLPAREVAPYELRAPIIFLTYGQHMLKTYRTTLQHIWGAYKGDAVRVDFSNKIVLFDEMHNLFDEYSPNLTTVQRRKLYGDKVKRKEAEQAEKATSDPRRARDLRESIAIYTGLSRLLDQTRHCKLIGLTATPIVDTGGRAPGRQSARHVLDWIRGRHGRRRSHASRPQSPVSRPQSPAGSEDEEEDDEEATAAAASATQTDEGYVSYFFMRPTELYASADELTYPTIMPIFPAGTPPPEALGLEHGEEQDGRRARASAHPTYGLKRIQALQDKYAIAKRAQEWFAEISSRPYYVPPPSTATTLLEYIPRSKAWSSDYHPLLSVSDERMPEWGEHLEPYGRSLPRRGQSVWHLTHGGGHGAPVQHRTPAWLTYDNASTSHTPHHVAVAVDDVDDDAELSRHRVLGTHGKTRLVEPMGTELQTAPLVEGIQSTVTHVVVQLDATPPVVQFRSAGDALVAELRVFRLGEARLKLPSHAPCLVVTVNAKDHTVARKPRSTGTKQGPRQYIVVRTHDDVGEDDVGEDDDDDDVIVCPVAVRYAERVVQTSNLEYQARQWYYEKEQLYETYATRLNHYIEQESSTWMRVFYGGRMVRASQGTEAQRVACRPSSNDPAAGLGGLFDPGHHHLTGFAVDMARGIVPWAMRDVQGKVLWLLNEHHGLALVQRWLACEEGRAWTEGGRVAVFGAYREEDRKATQERAMEHLATVFNAPDNVRGERCKLFIGGVNDMGTGMTFTELRHIVLDLASKHLSVLQQMGRGIRLCKHHRLTAQERTVQFHLPVPVLTTGWGTPETTPMQRTTRGGLGSVHTELSDYVEQYRLALQRKRISAPLHVPLPSFDTLCDLQRSRIKFLDGMQEFASVAVDREYYRSHAGWEMPRVDLTREPVSKSTVDTFVRNRVLNAVSAHAPFLAQGQSLLRSLSDENARVNDAVLHAVTPAVGMTTRDGDKAERFRQDVAAAREVARKKQEREAKKAAASCRNYVYRHGRFVRVDQPDLAVDQAAARRMMLKGVHAKDPYCQTLYAQTFGLQGFHPKKHE